MKKLTFAFTILFLCFTLSSCALQSPKYINFSVKPSNHYYIDEIKSKILNNQNFTLYVFDTNLYKEIEVPSEENSIIEDFVSALTTVNYSDESVDAKEPFRIKILFEDNSQYLFRIFNDSTISVSPWMGIIRKILYQLKIYR